MDIKTTAKEIILEERKMLREELKELKHCQIQYFTLSVTGTAAILGITKLFDNSISGSIFLIPLVIILPCWWIFFDKATSITRIVAYMRLLETGLSDLEKGKQVPFELYGWENALERWRLDQILSPLPVGYSILRGFASAFTKTPMLLIARSLHRYWIINWITYFSLSLVCMLIPIITIKSISWTYYIIGFSILCVAGSTAEMLLELMKGKFSFDNNEKNWWKLIGKGELHQ